LVTDRDPAFLKPGQLSDIRNMVYKNGATQLERAPGRAVFGAVSAVATGVVGLRDISFDNGDHYLVAMAGNKYRTSPVADTGTFADLATIAAGTSLEVVQYRNRFFLMNGASADASSIGTNVVAYLSATAAGTTLSTRQHGLVPVIAAPNVTTAGGGAAAVTATGYYEFWTTEVAKYTQDGNTLSLESAFSSETGPTTVFISATSVVPTVQRPIRRNASATHWRIYRSPKKDIASDKKFPTGFMIAELATGASSQADATATVSASGFAASANAAGYYFGWTTPSAAFVDDGNYASATVGGTLVENQQGYYAFPIALFTGAIKGIIVEVQGYVSAGTGPIPISVSIGRRRSSDGRFSGKAGGTPADFGPLSASKSGLITSTLSGSPTTLTLGSASDVWFPSNALIPGTFLTDVDFNPAAAEPFMVVVSTSLPSTSLGVDYVKLTVHYGATSESTIQFPTVVYTFGDITSQVAKNHPPPSSSTGDLFQDSLVVNDVSNPSLVRYSFPGEPESFPPTYFIDFETRDNDRVRAIHVVNNHLVVGLDTSLWRINYLPSERDSSFDRGKAIEAVSKTNGILGPMLCCTYAVDGGSEELAFISHKGLHTTDGFNFVTRSKNQDWRSIISLTSTSTPIALVNDPENRCLRFFYRNDSLGNETYMCLWASYDRGDIDGEGNFKFSGPVHSRNFDSAGGGYASVESACSVTRSTGGTSIFVGYGGASAAAGAGKVYLETGTTIPSNDQTCQYTTRRMYMAGMSAEWMLDELYGYCGSYTGAPLLTYTMKGTKTNDTGEVSKGTKSITLGGQKLHHVSPKVMVEGLRINMVCSGASAFQQEHLILGGPSFGLEDSGR
jgi:hypothetical protein